MAGLGAGEGSILAWPGASRVPGGERLGEEPWVSGLQQHAFSPDRARHGACALHQQVDITTPHLVVHARPEEAHLRVHPDPLLRGGKDGANLIGTQAHGGILDHGVWRQRHRRRPARAEGELDLG
ncbi:MAG: hypothetical protein U5L05_05655 [Rubrivivax sp.]|nr:hypothetical protein [Rubrivivax sp.]